MASSSKTVFVPEKKFLSIVYHDIFNYPLTERELKIWQVRGKEEDSWAVEKTGSFYHLPGRSETVLLRQRRNRISKVKLEKAKQAANILSKIPTVLFVGLTGSLSMKNAERESDIDLLIIAKEKTLWATRILVHLILAFYGVPRRKYESESSKDKLCLNMWMDERHLVIPKKERNIYTAHEVLQVIPLKNKDMAYERFLFANSWVGGYWKRNLKDNKYGVQNTLYIIFITPLRLLEPLAYRFQFARMRSRQTREAISSTRAFFHPVDWSFLATHEFESKRKQLLKDSSQIQFPLDKQTVVS